MRRCTTILRRVVTGNLSVLRKNYPVTTSITQNSWCHVNFDGATFVSERDEDRLTRQFHAVFSLMRDGVWRTPEEMEGATGYRWASIGARLRDFRKLKFGCHRVEREHLERGLFRYRLIVRRIIPLPIIEDANELVPSPT